MVTFNKNHRKSISIIEVIFLAAVVVFICLFVYWFFNGPREPLQS